MPGGGPRSRWRWTIVVLVVVALIALVVIVVATGDASPEREAEGSDEACASSSIALIRDATAGRTEAVRDAIEDGADVDGHDQHGNTPLACAGPRAGTDVISALLEAGADPATEDRFGDTVVADAVRFCRDDVLALLLDAGADPDEPGIEPSPLVQAIDRGRPSTVELLLDAGASPTPAPDALVIRGGEDAAECPRPTDAGRAQALGVVLDRGGDADAVLGRAITLGAWDAVAPSLAAGADPDADQALAPDDLVCDAAGAAVAEECGPLSGVTRLRGQPYDLEQADQSPAPTTALVHAAWAGEVDAVRALVEAGADPDVVAPLGATALAAAAGAGADAVVDLLLPLTTLPVGAGTVVASEVAEAAGHTDLAERLRLASA